MKKSLTFRLWQDCKIHFGKAKPYIHKPLGAPDYALPDLPYAFKSLNDYEFIDMEENEHEQTEEQRHDEA